MRIWDKIAVAMLIFFAVMGKFKGGFADGLPFFSKMSLMSVAQELGERGVEIAVTKIETG